jgi:hypothetical protein
MSRQAKRPDEIEDVFAALPVFRPQGRVGVFDKVDAARCDMASEQVVKRGDLVVCFVRSINEDIVFLEKANIRAGTTYGFSDQAPASTIVPQITM